MHVIVAGLTALMLCSSVMMGASVANASETGDKESQIAELTAKLAVLQSMLVKLLAGGSAVATSTPTAEEMKNPAIPLGTSITLVSGIQVRSDVGGKDTLLGIQATGTTGSIIAGPVKANDRIWYQVDFETGVDGWCLAGGLLKNSNVKELVPRPVRQATSSEVDGLKAVVGIPAKLEYLRSKLASTTNPVAQQKINDTISKLLQQQASNSLMRKEKASSTLEKVRKARATSTVERIVSPNSEETISGSVLGVSTDVYAEISHTLENIRIIIRGLEVTNK
jgi:hypothetical protein